MKITKLIITLLFLTSYFYYLPNAILAAIIIVAVVGLIDIKEAKHLFKQCLGKGRALLKSRVLYPRKALPCGLADPEIARNHIAQVGALRAGIGLGNLGIR